MKLSQSIKNSDVGTKTLRLCKKTSKQYIRIGKRTRKSQNRDGMIYLKKISKGSDGRES